MDVLSIFVAWCNILFFTYAIVKLIADRNPEGNMAHSHYYGRVHSPGHTDATRTGKKSDGLELNGFTKDHILEVNMFWNERDQCNVFQLRIRNRDTGRSYMIFSGSEAMLWNDASTGDVLAKDYMRRLLTGEANGNGNLPSR